MNKLYANGNYVIAEDGRGVHEYGKAKSVYSVVTNPDGYIIKEAIDTGELVIPTADIGLWFDETGTIAYTEATLVAFLRENTANFSSGGASTFQDLTDTPSYAGNALKWLRINAAANAIEAADLPSIDASQGTFAFYSSGVWSYFALLQDAINAVPFGGVIEMLKDYSISELSLTNPIEIISKDLTINLNGRKFQNDYDTGANLLTISSSTVTISNGTITANRPAGVSSPSFYVMSAVDNAVVNLDNVIMNTDFSRGWNVNLSEINGGIINSRYGVACNFSTLKNSTAITSLTGRGFSGSDCKIVSCYGESVGGVGGFFFGADAKIYDSTFICDTGGGLVMQGGMASQCIGQSNLQVGITSSTGGSISVNEPILMNCTGISNMNNGIYVFRGKAINSTGRSNIGNGILAIIDAEILNCVATSISGVGMNITAQSGTVEKGTIVRGGCAHSVENSAVVLTQLLTNSYIEVDGLRAESERDSTLGVGFYVSNVQVGHNGIFLRGCSAKTFNNSYAGLYGAGGIRAVSYVQCDLSRSSGTLQITQQAVVVEDAQGNII